MNLRKGRWKMEERERRQGLSTSEGRLLRDGKFNQNYFLCCGLDMAIERGSDGRVSSYVELAVVVGWTMGG